MGEDTNITTGVNFSPVYQFKPENGINISPEQYLRAQSLKIASTVKHETIGELLMDADRVVKYILEGK